MIELVALLSPFIASLNSAERMLLDTFWKGFLLLAVSILGARLLRQAPAIWLVRRLLNIRMRK